MKKIIQLFFILLMVELVLINTCEALGTFKSFERPDKNSIHDLRDQDKNRDRVFPDDESKPKMEIFLNREDRKAFYGKSRVVTIYKRYRKLEHYTAAVNGKIVFSGDSASQIVEYFKQYNEKKPIYFDLTNLPVNKADAFLTALAVHHIGGFQTEENIKFFFDGEIAEPPKFDSPATVMEGQYKGWQYFKCTIRLFMDGIYSINGLINTITVHFFARTPEDANNFKSSLETNALSSQYISELIFKARRDMKYAGVRESDLHIYLNEIKESNYVNFIFKYAS